MNSFLRFLNNPVAFLKSSANDVNWLVILATLVLLVGIVVVFKRLLKKLQQAKPIADTQQFPGDEAAFRAIFINSTIGVALLDSKERILTANPAVSRILGYNASHLDSAPLSNFVHPEDAHQDKTLFNDVKEGERKQYILERRFFHQNGKMLWLRQEVVGLKGRPLLDGTAGAVAAVFLQDVTAEQSAAEELTVTRDAVSSLHQVVVDRDSDFLDKLRSLLEMGCRRYGVETGVIGQVVPRGFEVMQVVSPDERIRPGRVYERNTPGPDTPNQVTARNRRLYQTDESRSADFAPDWRDFPFYSVADVDVFLSVPILVHEQVFGVLCFSGVTERPKPFVAADREFLQLMAQWLGGELERLQAQAELEARQRSLIEANTAPNIVNPADDITSAKNRRAYEEQLEAEFRRARTYNGNLSVLALGFENYREHAAALGETVMNQAQCQLADILVANVREMDFVARYNNGEFMLLLPYTDALGATKLAKRLQHIIKSLEWPDPTMTVDAGSATLTVDVRDPHELTEAAQRALSSKVVITTG